MNLMMDNNIPLKRLIFMLLCCLVLSACLGGNVVTVTEVSDSAQAIKALELKKADVAKFEEYKKTAVAKDPGTNPISDLIQKSSSLNVSEYLAKYPDGKDAISDYRIGGYDVLSVTVYEEKDLSRENVRVTAEGDITFPLIGRVKVVDFTTTEVERLIAKMLAEKQYLLDAHVSVMVVKYEGRKFSVLGAVATPGLYPLQARERVLDGISKAGGLMSSSMRGTAGQRDESLALEGMIIRTIKHGKPDEKKIIINFDLQGLLKGRDQNANIFLAENDVLYIPTADFFYIIGEVKTPGSYPFTKKEITIAEAISMAGGFTRIASRNKTRVVRVEKGVEKIFEVKMDAITQSGKMTQAMSIKPNDLIIVPESFF